MKSKKTILLMAFFQIIGVINYAQIKFEYSYNSGRNDQARAITQTIDSGYAVVGSTVNYEGNTDVYLIKTNQLGILQWAKRYGELGIEWGEDIIETRDSGLAILGYGHNNGVYDMLFIKTDKNGDSIYTKLIGEADWDFGHALKQTSDNGFILAGESYSNGNSKAYLVKLDANGNTEWKKNFGGIQNSKFEDIVIASNGDFVMAGETEAFGNGRQVYLVRTDSLGTLIWEKNYGNPGIDFAKSITKMSSGDFVFAGGTNTPPFLDIDNWAGKIDPSGVLIQSEVIIDYTSSTLTVQNDDWNETVVNYNDSLIFAGQRSYHNEESGNIYIYRFSNNLTSGNGQGDFQKFISPNIEIAYDSKMTFDKGVVFACTAEFMSSSSESSIYLIKMDSSMNFPHPYPNTISHQSDYSSISEKEKKIEFSIYPNPSSAITNINLEKFNSEKVTVTIFDSYSKLLISESTSSVNYIFDGTNHPAGIYFVKVSSNEFVMTKRFIITK